MLRPIQNCKIAIIGLGYVGLPLAVEFAKKFPVVGYDIDQKRIGELISGRDNTLEVEDDLLKVVLSIENPKSGTTGLFPTFDSDALDDCQIYIVTVPTPTDKHNRPVLTPMLKASENIAKYLKKGDVVIYE